MAARLSPDDIRQSARFRPATKVVLRRGLRPKTVPTGITGVGSAHAEVVLTNADLELMVDTSDDWIMSRTGISERRIAAPGTTTSMLATTAASRATTRAGIDPADLDLIIVATATPDMSFPATACLVQRNIGAVRAAAFDLSVGCTGFLYALAAGAQFVQSGRYQKVLVIGADILSRIVNWKDRNTCVLFGDGAGAAILEPVSEGSGVLSMHLGSDGWGSDHLRLPAGGSLMPASVETVEGGLHSIHMNGPEVFKFAVKVMSQASLAVLRQAGLKKSDLDFLIPHQANTRIIEAARHRLGLDPGQVLVNIDRYGNTSAASIPIALDEALTSGKIKPGNIVLMVAFGAGLTWASCVVRWT